MFTVYELKNVELLTGGKRVEITQIPGTKRDVMKFVKYGGVIPTHMGELRKTIGGYIYYTTIGRTYLFMKEGSNGSLHDRRPT